MEIIWSPQSLLDLEFIGDFIADDSLLRAIAFIDELLLSVERLKEFPESGSIVQENTIFRQVVKDGYRLIYQIRPEKIFIITVLGPGQMLGCP